MSARLSMHAPSERSGALAYSAETHVRCARRLGWAADIQVLLAGVVHSPKRLAIASASSTISLMQS
jgi:hypothetical protein